MISLCNRVPPPLLAVFLSTLSFVGCGGGGYPTQPGRKPGTSSGGLRDFVLTSTAAPSIPVAGTVQLIASGYYDVPIGQNSFQDLTNSALWSTSKASVATVNHGLVTGLGVGSAIITATFNGKTDSRTVAVGLTPTIAITPTGTGMFSRAATDQQFFAMGTYPDGTVIDLTNFATWSSDPGQVVEFNFHDPYGFNPGLAAFVGTGTTTIAATLGTGEVGTMVITVVP